MIDVSEMATIRTGAGTATVGAGAKVIDVAASFASAGSVIPAGTCPTVGISGLTLGGGQGIVGRRFGLTCDSLRAARVVLADGRVVSCDASRQADLFWALRGAGGGNLGVVTSFTFASHPLSAITAFSMSWPWSDATDVVAAWQRWGPSAPAPLWSSCRLRWIPGTGPSVSVSGAWSGPPSGLARHLDELASASRHAPSRSTVTRNASVAPGCPGPVESRTSVAVHEPSGMSANAARIRRSAYSSTSAQGAPEVMIDASRLAPTASITVPTAWAWTFTIIAPS